MVRPQWTLLLISDDRTSVRQYRVSRLAIQVAVAAALVLVAALSSLATRLLGRVESGVENHRLAAENLLLQGELDGLHSRMDTLHVTLEQLSDKDAYYRLLAGLEPLDPDVRQAGVGGPGGVTEATSPLWSVDALAAHRTFAVSTELNTLIRRARLLEDSWREAEGTLQEKQDQLAATPSIFPTHGYISSVFTMARWHPLLHRTRPHEGLDIVAPKGSPVVAAAKGRIRFAGTEGDYGIMVEIDHGYGLVTRYAHLSRTLVRPGQTVQRGDLIGRVGETGLAVGPHLHYEVLRNGHPVNPRHYIFEGDAIPD